MVAADANAKCPKGLVLIVEDDDDTRELLAVIVETAGYMVHKVATVAIARKLLIQHAYTCVLLDIGLPDENGYVLLGFLRRVRSELPVIAVTAFSTAVDRDTIVTAYPYAIHMPKPFEPGELLAQIKAAADGTFSQINRLLVTNTGTSVALPSPPTSSSQTYRVQHIDKLSRAL